MEEKAKIITIIIKAHTDRHSFVSPFLPSLSLSPMAIVASTSIHHWALDPHVSHMYAAPLNNSRKRRHDDDDHEEEENYNHNTNKAATVDQPSPWLLDLVSCVPDTTDFGYYLCQSETDFCDALLRADLAAPHDHRIDGPMFNQCLNLVFCPEKQCIAQQQRHHQEQLRSVATLPIWSQRQRPKLNPDEQLQEVPPAPARPYPLWNLSVSSNTPLELYPPASYGLQHLIHCLVDVFEHATPQITYADRDFSE